jgi:cytosine/adenosine deaminase-related metal-dependent hydrolase
MIFRGGSHALESFLLPILTAAWVMPINRTAIRDGRVAVEDGTITWVGGPSDAGAPSGAVEDLGAGVLLPGLVNAHCHLELSHLKGRLDRSAGFAHWVEDLVGKRGADGPGAVRAAIARAIRQVEATGTVAVADVSNDLAHLDLLAASHLTAVVFHELLGWNPARAAAIAEGADARRRGPQGDGVDIRLAAHAPHSVSPALFDELVKRGGPAAIHLAESAEESRFLLRGDGAWMRFLERRGLGDLPFDPPGVSPVRYLDDLGALRPGLVAAHCVYVDAADRHRLVAKGVHVAVCPRSNLNLGVGLPPVPDLLDAGVPLCLGTDSLASVDTLDLIDDAVTLREEFPELDPAVIVEMATAGGARALGLAGLGTLAPGMRAELAFAPAGQAPSDPAAFLVSGEARPRRVDV